MPKPSSQKIILLDTPFYLICGRSVHKTFVCGIDNEKGA
ncbi:MAG: hypothetical protein ACI971_001345 [Colwellia sp.]|jgi:hypothetical protein